MRLPRLIWDLLAGLIAMAIFIPIMYRFVLAFSEALHQMRP